MQHSESIAKIAPALVKAQAEIEPAPKSAENPYFKSKYTPLPVVMATVGATLAKYELAVVQTFEPSEPLPASRTGIDDKGQTVEKKWHACGTVLISTTLVHSSGEWIGGTLSMPIVKPDPQATGSAITYARRYAIAALLGVVSDEDDDGEGAMNRNKKPPKAGDGAEDIEEFL
jgi:hypothetical protein